MTTKEEWQTALAEDERQLARLQGCLDDGWIPANMSPEGLAATMAGLRAAIAAKRELLAKLEAAPRVTLKVAIREAVAVGDAPRAARIAGRFATYRDALAFAQDCCPGLTPAAWDALLYEADAAEAEDEGDMRRGAKAG